MASVIIAFLCDEPHVGAAAFGGAIIFGMLTAGLWPDQREATGASPPYAYTFTEYQSVTDFIMNEEKIVVQTDRGQQWVFDDYLNLHSWFADSARIVRIEYNVSADGDTVITSYKLGGE